MVRVVCGLLALVLLAITAFIVLFWAAHYYGYGARDIGLRPLALAAMPAVVAAICMWRAIRGDRWP